MAIFTHLIMMFLLCYLLSFAEIQGKLAEFENSPLLRHKRTSVPPPTLRSVAEKMLFLGGSMFLTGYAGIQFKKAMNRDNYVKQHSLEEKRRRSQEQQQKEAEPAHCAFNRLSYLGWGCSSPKPKEKPQGQGIKRTQSWEEKQQEERSQLALARKEPMKVKRTQSMTNLKVEVGQQQQNGGVQGQEGPKTNSPNSPPKSFIQGLGQVGQIMLRNAAQSSKMRIERQRQQQEQEGKKP